MDGSMGMPRYQWTRPALGVVACVLPTAYLWSLPLLARAGFAERGPDPTGVGKSVSHYISNAPATGLLAATFQWPIMQLWERHGIAYLEATCSSRDSAAERLAVRAFGSLVCMLVAFGGFVTFTVSWQPRVHVFFVTVMCLSGLVHFHLLLRLGAARGGFGAGAAAPLVLGFAGFGAVICCVAFTKLFGGNAGYGFWVSESLGLTGMVWCTTCDDHAAPAVDRLRRSMSASRKRVPAVAAAPAASECDGAAPRSPV